MPHTPDKPGSPKTPRKVPVTKSGFDAFHKKRMADKKVTDKAKLAKDNRAKSRAHIKKRRDANAKRGAEIRAKNAKEKKAKEANSPGARLLKAMTGK